MFGLEKLGLVDQNWLERNVSVFLLRTLVVGRRQHSESIEVALDNMEYSRCPDLPACSGKTKKNR